MSDVPIALAGATGDLGFRIAQALLDRHATLRVLVRPGSAAKPEITQLRTRGAEVVEVDFASLPGLYRALAGVGCVVSALSGLHDVIVTTQTRLLDAAVAAGVARFIPSDFAIDFTKLPEGSNRNLDLRREFGRLLDRAPIKATSILNGMFMDLLTGQAPVILQGIHRVLYWGSPDQPLDFTTTADTATYTAAAALDASTPRYLRIAGETASPRQLQAEASAATGQPYGLLRPGGVGQLKLLSEVARRLTPSSGEVFPAWQGMQYLYNMFTGLPRLAPLDNDRYPALRWTQVREVLASQAAPAAADLATTTR